MKTIIISIASLLIFVWSSGCGGKKESGAIQIKVAWVLPDTHPTSEALKFFKERLEKESNGEINVLLFSNGILGDATGCIESMKSGNIEMTAISAAPLSQFSKEFNVLTMPFLFRDKAHEYSVVDGKIGSSLANTLTQVDLQGLGYFDAGSRNIMTKKGPITKPEDLKGLKIRVMSSKLMIDSLNALGASAVAMGQGEVYSALQTGVLDGWENNPPTALTFKMFETGCTQYAWTRHLAVPDVLVISKPFLDKLSENHKQLILKIAKETVVEQRKRWQKGEQAAIQQLTEAGMVFNEVDHDAFAQCVEPLYKDYYKKNGKWFKELCENIKAVQ